jgi:hypothetical protein
MIKWFKKKFKQWSIEAWNSERLEKDVSIGIGISTIESRSIHSDPVLNFTIYNAIGGKIVEFRYHDRKSDRSHTQMYIIGKDDDFGERIAKIATLEVLKQ